MDPRIVARLAIASVAAITVIRCANGNEIAVVQPYVANDVVGIAYLDLSVVDLPAAIEQFGPVLGLPADQLHQVSQVAAAVQSRIEQFRQQGVGRVYVLLRTADIAYGGPTWIAPVKESELLQQIVGQLDELVSTEPPRNTSLLPAHFATENGLVLAASTAEQLELLKASRWTSADIRSDALAALVQVDGHAAGLVLFGDIDSRRVIRELFPPLSPPFEGINGRLIADEIRWAGLTVDLPPNLQVQATLQLTDKDEARALEGSVDKALRLGKAILLKHWADTPDEVPSTLVDALNSLQPVVDKACVSLTLGDDPVEVVAIGRLLAGALRPAQQAAHRNQRMNQFKQIALALHNYEGREKSFPPAAIYVEQGRPLLSWRVAILPFLEQQSLYDQFHLDEPWDSPHNRQLIPQMPEIYADPDAAVRREVEGQGRTTFVVPTGDQTVFRGTEGMKIKDITDGTSRTILAVEVVPDRAVIWTKPDDWKVDWTDPLDGVRRTDGRPFTAIRCDGSAHIISNDIDPDAWAKLLTATGGEVVK